MPGRTYSSAAYSYGFNGKEKDDEISGSGNNLDFGARIYDSRLGRWMSVDPLYNHPKNISQSSYNFAVNSPIIAIDKDGRIWWVVIGAAIGGTVDATIGIVKGEDRSQIIGRFVRGAAIGAGLTGLPILLGTYGVTGAAALQGTIYATPFITMVGEGLGQTTRYLLSGGKRKFDEDEFVMSLAYSIPETILGGLIGEAGVLITKPIKEGISEGVVKEALSSQVEKEIKKDIKKTLRKKAKEEGKFLTKNELKTTTTNLYNMVMESQTGYVNSTIIKNQEKVKVCAASGEKIIEAGVKELSVDEKKD